MSQKTQKLPAHAAPYSQHHAFTQAISLNVSHGFFGRQGGVSPAPYASLNVGLSTGDKPENAMQNRSLAVQSFTGLEMRPFMVHQTHSAQCVTLSNEAHNLTHELTQEKCAQMEADAIITDIPNTPIAVQTADCVPILFAATKRSSEHPIIAAAHAGWKGALYGIIENTVQAILDLGAEPSTIAACIGPCIGFDSYEVDINFYNNYILESNSNAQFFKPSHNKDHFYFNIENYAKEKLVSNSIQKIFSLSIDTYAEKELFYSHRRATHENRSAEGRQLSAIMIAPQISA